MRCQHLNVVAVSGLYNGQFSLGANRWLAEVFSCDNGLSPVLTANNLFLEFQLRSQ